MPARTIMFDDGSNNKGEEASVLLRTALTDKLQLAEAHLAFFRDCYPAPPIFQVGDDLEGKSPRDWYAGGPEQRPSVALNRLGNRLNRAMLIALQSDPSISTLELCIAILAWGGMHGSNRTHLFKREVTPWLNLAKRIRDGHLTRKTAFDDFAALNHNGSLAGMGPAYYTKLIYFLMPRAGANPIGYIMDQWLGCSVNLLCEQEVILLDQTAVWVSQGRGAAKEVARQASARVSPINSGDQYERFCRAIELLATQMGANWTPEAAELALMSKGGRRPAAWRAHVSQHRLPGLIEKHGRHVCAQVEP